MTHPLAEMMAEAAKRYVARLELLVERAQVCPDCGVNPIEVIHQPPSFDVALIDDADEQFRGIGLPVRNPYVQNGRQVRIIEMLRLLCLECSRRRAGV